MRGFRHIRYLLCIFSAVLLAGCFQFEPERANKVETGSVHAVDQTSCTAEGDILEIGIEGIDQHGFCYGTLPDPVIGTGLTVDLGSRNTSGTFSVKVTGLSPVTTYYLRAFTTSSSGTVYGSQKQFTTLQDNRAADYDGNIYITVDIGAQTWMAENLKTTHYADGTEIPLVEDNGSWDALSVSDKAYCWYNNSNSNGGVYGALYTWAAATGGNAGNDLNPSGIQGVCPDGWHLPSDSEWKQLEMYLGMSQAEADATGLRGTDEGGKMKETGTAHWSSPNTGATNSSGFTALPGGGRYIDGTFVKLGTDAYFWTATSSTLTAAWGRYLYHDNAPIYRYAGDKDSGMAVRCVKD